ncbi:MULTISPECIES: hypothetical protein [unclassified Salinibacterium]|uniref:hypothetical protein n=1 Tax=unclassified Salinibacterium TaxID=2632331 RepID=UPI0018CD9ABC|nr:MULTISPECIES: hypothetical protein [unclassified Salinibacterium]MBH0022593.1 hypothetical protein [Salinibacterium sp. SWN248]MBH0052635.1 hypothetical protein [Salinibacterium sp. SWN139]MBH0081901.1 hypothetical protein [Salinibacterium sp. SWN167]
MNRKVFGWVVVLLASLTAAAAAAVWLIVAGTGLDVAAGIPPLPTLVLGLSALLAIVSSFALIRAELPPHRSHMRATYISRRTGAA